VVLRRGPGTGLGVYETHPLSTFRKLTLPYEGQLATWCGKEIENQYLSPNENPITARAGLVVPF
jgi:hypothetical protein